MGNSSQPIPPTFMRIVGNGGNDTDLGRDDIYDILSSSRRCHVLEYLNQQNDHPTEVGELVDYVAMCEYDTEIDEIGYRERKRVYNALRQSHLPKLAKLGIVDYDRDRGEITPTNQTRRIQRYLEYVPDYEVPWHRYYLVLTAISVGLIAGVAVNLFPFGALSWASVSVLIVVLFGISAIIHAFVAMQASRTHSATSEQSHVRS